MVQPAGDCQSLESETNGELDVNSWEDLILESRVLTVQYLNLVMKLCCLSDKMRERGNKIKSREGKWG